MSSERPRGSPFWPPESSLSRCVVWTEQRPKRLSDYLAICRASRWFSPCAGLDEACDRALALFYKLFRSSHDRYGCTRTVRLRGAMPVRFSHGRPHAESPRADELPVIDAAALTAPDRDPQTGKFTAGNAASRLRTLKRQARALPWLDESRCEPWLRPFVVAAKDHAADLLAELPRDAGPLLAPVAEELAGARIVYRALLARGLEGDPAALESARAWLREARQHALALEGLARKPLPKGEGDDAPPPWLVASKPKDKQP